MTGQKRTSRSVRTVDGAKMKFKVGDVYKGGKYKNNEYTVIKIITQPEQITGVWGIEKITCTKTLENRYLSICDSVYYWTDIASEDAYELVIRSSKAQTDVCPRCTSTLIEKMSIGLGEMIKKCSNPKCGWC